MTKGMQQETLVKKALPQRPEVEVLVPNYKEPILPVNHGGFGWFGLQAYNEKGQLMCHECGTFWDNLSHHAVKHGLHPREYRVKYGLCLRAELTSRAQQDKQRQNYFALPAELRERLTAHLRKDRISASDVRLRSSIKYSKNSLQFQNAADTCPAQVLRALSVCAQTYGPQVTAA